MSKCSPLRHTVFPVMVNQTFLFALWSSRMNHSHAWWHAFVIPVIWEAEEGLQV